MSARENFGFAGIVFLAVGLIMLAAGAFDLDGVDWRWFAATVSAFLWALILFVIYRRRPRWLMDDVTARTGS